MTLGGDQTESPFGRGEKVGASAAQWVWTRGTAAQRAWLLAALGSAAPATCLVGAAVFVACLR